MSKIYPFETPDGETIEYLRLTYDEELNIARMFCDMLDRVGTESYESIYEPLCRLFIKKSYGNDFRMDELEGLEDAINKYHERYDDDWVAEHGYPVLSDALTDPGEQISLTVPAHQEGKADFKLMYRREITRAWKEAWNEHPRGYLRERFDHTFPGEHILNPPPTADDRWEEDQKLEREFWAMVDEKQEYFECSRHQAILEVSDYIPRAQFDENRMADPNPLKVVKPVIDIDQFAKDRGMEVSEWEKEGEYDDKETM